MKRNLILKLILKNLSEILASKCEFKNAKILTKRIINKFFIWHPQSRECFYSFCIVVFLTYNIEYLLAYSVMLITNQSFGNPNTRWRWFSKLISLSLTYHQMLKILFQNIILLKVLKRWHWFLILILSRFNCFDTQEVTLIIIFYSIFFPIIFSSFLFHLKSFNDFIIIVFLSFFRYLFSLFIHFDYK